MAFGAAQASHFFLFLAYWYLETDPQRWISNTTLMFLSAPLLDGSVTWARLFYFDLSKLDGRMLSPSLKEAWFTMARPRGCSEPLSAEAASLRTSSSENPFNEE